MMTRLTLSLLAAATVACAARSPANGASSASVEAPVTLAASGTAAAPAAGDASTDSQKVPAQASGSAVASATSKVPRRKTTGSITADELSDASFANIDAYSAVQRLRPSFLTSRGNTSLRGNSGGVLVSIDRAPPASLSSLRALRASEVAEIAYLSASEAGQQFGTSARNAAVLVVTRR